MKTLNLKSLAALLIVPAFLNSSALAGPGPHLPAPKPTHTTAETTVPLQRAKVTTAASSPKGRVVVYPTSTLLTSR